MKNLIDILKDVPRGTKLYSPICGECELAEVECNIAVHYISPSGSLCECIFNRFGQYTDVGECLLFPSKFSKNWDNFIQPFKPFDKVLTRDGVSFPWRINIFSHYVPENDYPYVTIRSASKYCIPYNEKTAHLVGTYDNI